MQQTFASSAGPRDGQEESVAKFTSSRRAGHQTAPELDTQSELHDDDDEVAKVCQNNWPPKSPTQSKHTQVKQRAKVF